MQFILLILSLFIAGCSLTNGPTQPQNEKERFLTRGLSLHDAIRLQDKEVIQFLSSKKENINKKDKYGYTPLHLAVRLNDITTVKQLIQNGAQVNTTDQYGDTPLLDATRNKLTNISEVLICNGANLNVFDDQKKTPLNYATLTEDNYISTMLKNSKTASYYCKNKIQFTIDVPQTVYTLTPTICGTVNHTAKSEIKLILQNETIYGPYIAKLKPNSRSWCIDIPESLQEGSYQATVTVNILNRQLSKQKEFTIALPKKNENSSVEQPIKPSQLQIEDISEAIDYSIAPDYDEDILKTPYNALYEEFKEDFEKWDAQLDQNTLIFRFKSPHLMFQHGQNRLKKDYKKVLDNFFPRYVKIIEDHEIYIENIFVEGHTSSQYRAAKTQEEKFQYNMQLSQKRAQAVVNYILTINDVIVSENAQWLYDIFKPIGKSSSQPITNPDGSENASLSRRVEFRIKLSKNGEIQ